MNIVKYFMVIMCCMATAAHAECPFGCLFTPGTKCVDNACVSVVVPSPTPSPDPLPIQTPIPKAMEIVLESKPLAQIETKVFDCSGLDMSRIKVVLIRKTLPGPVSFYSAISIPGETIVWCARKDILNKFVFLSYASGDKITAQFSGEDFSWDRWENKAFDGIFISQTCDALKKAGWVFTFGLATDGAAFTFK